MSSIVDLHHLFSPEMRSDPHAYWREVRATTPVAWSPLLNAWVVSTYFAASAILADRRFTTDVYAEFRPSPLGIRSSFELEDVQNNRYRKVLGPLSSFHALDHSFIAALCKSLALQLPVSEPFEFAESFVEPLSTGLVEHWLGIDQEKRTEFTFLMDVIASDPDIARKKAARELLVDRILALITLHRVHPTATLLSQLSVAWSDAGFADHDLASYLGPMLLSLVEHSNNRLLMHAILAAVTFPNLQQYLRSEGTAGARNFALEAARWEPVTQVLPRRVTNSLKDFDVEMREGQRVLVVLTSACRDAERHPDPDIFVPNRQERSLAFGAGQHSCLGFDIAITVTAAALVSLFGDGTTLIQLEPSEPPAFTVLFGRACDRLVVSKKSSREVGP